MANGLILPDIAGQFAAGQERGIRNALMQQELAAQQAAAERQQQYQNALAQYMGGDQRPEVLNALYQADPEQTNAMVQFQGEQQARQREFDQVQAQEMVALADVLDSSPDPVRTFQIAGGRLADGSNLVEELDRMGVINVADGIQPEEVANISRALRERFSPIAGGEERAEPSAIREMRTLGYSLDSEGFRQYQADKGVGGVGELETVLAHLKISGEQARQAREAQQEAERQLERQQAQVRKQNSITRSLGQTGDIVGYVDQLEDSMLQVGIPFAEARRTAAGVLAGLGSVAGVDVSELRGQIGAFDKLKKGLSDQLINLMESGEMSRGTNAILKQYQDALASPETSPAAVMAIQASIAETLLDEAEASGIEVPNREQVQENIARLRGYGGASEATTTPAQISKMTVEDLQGLDLDALTDKQREAVAKRLDDLGL